MNPRRLPPLVPLLATALAACAHASATPAGTAPAPGNVAAAAPASAGTGAAPAPATAAPAPGTGTPATAGTAGAAPLSTAELDSLYRARMASARARHSAADVRFMTGMIGHHAQALVMAGMAPTHGASGPIQTLAARIINAQRDEIATMQQWLRDRSEPVPEVHIMGTMVMLHGAGDEMPMMPGMLTPEQMNQLDAARGAAFDRLFLTFMIQHHLGAVSMVNDLFATDGAARDETVFKLASDVQVDQRTEIARMQLMLAKMPATGTR